ncbi:MAG: hypothetical protein GXY41_01860 [Phycisphaerae bacterium]|nr:hypothetical protein [Phycisphaerae bacterium]
MKKILWVMAMASLVGVLSSCASAPEPEQPTPVNFDNTVGDLARVVDSPAVAVRGFGIVAGLFGTGSAECPPALRQELEKYIWQQLPDAGTINPRQFIDSLDTAVVEVLGVIPPMAAAGQSFDVVVRPLSSTQTTSLTGGHLYTTDLKELSRFTQFNQYAKTIARAQGPIFADRSRPADAPNWYILGGGHPLSSTNVSLLLNQPDFVAASTIRNRINERFGAKTANAVSPGEILLSIPEKHRTDQVRFVTMIRQLYLADQPALQKQRIAELIDRLRNLPDKLLPETALEAIGKAALDKLAPLLKSDDDAVRFHAARCMFNLDDNRALPILRDLVLDPHSPWRSDALRTIGRNARRNVAEPILLHALAQDDFNLRLVAYETALASKSEFVSRSLVGGYFFVDRVNCAGPKAIYALRSDRPGIVIFGAPVRCAENIFFRSDNGEVTVNVRPGDRFISISRTHPIRPRVIGPIPSGFDISQFIRAMGESPETPKGTTTLPGLALPYCQIIDILEKMCKQKAIDAVYLQGPITTASAIFQDL